MVQNNSRLIAIKILQEVLMNKKSLASLSNLIKQSVQPAFTQAIVYGVLRYYWELQAIQKNFISKPLKTKDLDIELLILIGLFQLKYLAIPAHAAISETVEVCRVLKKIWATKLVNAILRGFQRQPVAQQTSDKQIDEATYNHPEWFIRKVQQAYPKDWQAILEANNQFPPMSIRVNRNKISPQTYIEKLQQVEINARLSEISVDGIVLDQPCMVDQLPNFLDGDCSVQDIAAQLAAQILAPKRNEKILDACAAPGGKTMHLFEIEPSIQVLAIDHDAERLKRVEENALRINAELITNQKLTLKCAAAEDLAVWWDKTLFDKILLDAPCSATGVIRRHPDIKHLRLVEDFSELAKLQLSLLKELWQTLKPNGELLYATCSILPQENEEVIHAFLQQQQDVTVLPITINAGLAQKYGRQILPGMDTMDGFYYCLLKKR